MGLPSELGCRFCPRIAADVSRILQVKPEPEDTAMTPDASPSSLPTTQQPVKAEPPSQPSADPHTDLPDPSVQQAGAAVGGVGGSAAAMPSNAGGRPPAGSPLTPESSAQVALGTSCGCTYMQLS